MRIKKSTPALIIIILLFVMIFAAISSQHITDIKTSHDINIQGILDEREFIITR